MSQRMGKVTSEMRERWNAQCDTVFKAVETGLIQLDDYDMEFMDGVQKLLSDGKDLTFRRSKHLRTVYNLIH